MKRGSEEVNPADTWSLNFSLENVEKIQLSFV
jgi:hypothetical protein